MWEVWYNQEHIYKYPQILCQRWDYGFSHFVNLEVLNFRFWALYYLLSRAADDHVWGYVPCTKSVVISSISVANLGCSQKHGKRKEEWMARGDLDADDWVKILGLLQKNCHQLLRPTHCVTSGFHAPVSNVVVPVKVVPNTHWQCVWSWDDIFLTTGLQVHISADTWNWCPSSSISFPGFCIACTGACHYKNLQFH